jgi:hypothetical protein
LPPSASSIHSCDSVYFFSWAIVAPLVKCDIIELNRLPGVYGLAVYMIWSSEVTNALSTAKIGITEYCDSVYFFSWAIVAPLVKCDIIELKRAYLRDRDASLSWPTAARLVSPLLPDQLVPYTCLRPIEPTARCISIVAPLVKCDIIELKGAYLRDRDASLPVQMSCTSTIAQLKKYTESHEWIELADGGKTG